MKRLAICGTARMVVVVVDGASLPPLAPQEALAVTAPVYVDIFSAPWSQREGDRNHLCVLSSDGFGTGGPGGNGVTTESFRNTMS